MSVMVKVDVTRSVKNHQQGIVKKRLAGPLRQRVHKTLKSTKPSNYFFEEFGKMRDEEVDRNHTKCQRQDVLRKAKSELSKQDLLHPEPFTEIVTSKEIFDENDVDSRKTKGYIHKISYEPFMIVLYTEISISVAKQCINNGTGIFYFDATGSVVKERYDRKRMLYNARVVRGNNTPTVPVLEFLNDHQTTYYVRPLLTFQGLFRVNLQTKTNRD